ncbi:hypothetical protein RND71_005783 [Anisodus tanguticus]|uniref:Uncharacterized protein n=1 Tax=Anisodus tanguticus TaxID=243964 RepID=A0AAE1SSU9_9SOLA|nr:hypothetical protein RND71_005783 [Anisodus tanguticus]
MYESKDTVNLLCRPTNFADRNLRRRTRYAQMSLERKQLFLSRLRDKRAESKKRELLHPSSTTASSPEVDSRPPKRRALTIITPSLSPEEGELVCSARAHNNQEAIDAFGVAERRHFGLQMVRERSSSLEPCTLHMP